MSALALRPQQVATLDSLRNAFRAGHRAVMLYGPTGFGKTELAISLMDAVAKKGNRAAIVLDRILLCNQTSERLQKYHIDHGVLQSGHWRYRPYEHIQVCSAQTLEKRGSFPGLDLMIVDEAHAQRMQTTEFIRSNPHIRVVGLSASPFTKGLGKTYSEVVSSTTTKELVEAGWLAPLRVFVAQEIDMTGAKKVAGEWSQAEATERGIRITGDVVAEWIKKTHEVFGRPRKTIVFCAGVAHGADLSQKFADAGYNFVSISYKDDDEFKREVVEDFAKPDSQIHGLIATDILTKGFDVSDVMIGVSARPFSKSFSSHVQQMGRVMRPHEGKEFALWLDHSGNYLRFRRQWEDLYSGGVSELDDGAEKTAKEPTDKEKEASKCPVCGSLWPGKSDVCLHCGHVRVRRNDVIDVNGVMVEIGSEAAKEAWPVEMKQAFYQQLIGYAESKGYKPGWAFYAYQDKFGVEPSTRFDRTPEQPSLEVLRFIQHRNIKKAKAKK